MCQLPNGVLEIGNHGRRAALRGSSDVLCLLNMTSPSGLTHHDLGGDYIRADL